MHSIPFSPSGSETGLFADYIPPIGHGAGRYGMMSQETHGGGWIALRQLRPDLEAYSLPEWQPGDSAQALAHHGCVGGNL
ncbi:MAG: hypothetical protein NZ699_00315 [Roseiflexus sp.]|nr:hypothetical protein [Roseiflexus sp.]MCS7287552.1 hypothetical protein [Roseiflexus sp.]MDW8148577.1 hypothetical protein [Roseiflexaceae bacterium]MDW8231773.1 hypothetical protein [Roseiflexaceae bacterium]